MDAVNDAPHTQQPCNGCGNAALSDEGGAATRRRSAARSRGRPPQGVAELEQRVELMSCELEVSGLVYTCLIQCSLKWHAAVRAARVALQACSTARGCVHGLLAQHPVVYRCSSAYTTMHRCQKVLQGEWA